MVTSLLPAAVVFLLLAAATFLAAAVLFLADIALVAFADLPDFATTSESFRFLVVFFVAGFFLAPADFFLLAAVLADFALADEGAFFLVGDFLAAAFAFFVPLAVFRVVATYRTSVIAPPVFMRTDAERIHHRCGKAPIYRLVKRGFLGKQDGL